MKEVLNKLVSLNEKLLYCRRHCQENERTVHKLEKNTYKDIFDKGLY